MGLFISKQHQVKASGAVHFPANNPADCVTWVNGSHGEVPSSAWDATLTTGTKHLYIGRAEHDGGVFPGTLVPQKGVAHIPWGGLNYEKKEYQVLTVNNNKNCVL